MGPSHTCEDVRFSRLSPRMTRLPCDSMRILILVAGLLLAPLWHAAAQVLVEINFEQEQFLPGETLPAIVKIHNRSGQTLHLGRDTDWLTFSIESKDGFVVAKNGEAPVTG